MMEKARFDPGFEALLAYIEESRCVDFRGYKRTSLGRRIALRMAVTNAGSFAAYQSRLETDPGEFESLLNAVLINVTSFFRDEAAWAVLQKQVIPAIIAHAKGDQPIRVSSVGCATGEEPYSIAMLFAEAMGDEEFCRRVRIYASDLDEEALRTARLAAYCAHAVENVPPMLLARYFDRIDDHYVLHRALRDCVIFGRHNVVEDVPDSRIDLLVCRNLLIYLDAETQGAILGQLHRVLARRGFLFLGRAETQLARSHLFRPIEARHRIFAKLAARRRARLNESMFRDSVPPREMIGV
jgi:two-component system CheB/CheR fusion protein